MTAVTGRCYPYIYVFSSQRDNPLKNKKKRGYFILVTNF